MVLIVPFPHLRGAVQYATDAELRRSRLRRATPDNARGASSTGPRKAYASRSHHVQGKLSLITAFAGRSREQRQAQCLGPRH